MSELTFIILFAILSFANAVVLLFTRNERRIIRKIEAEIITAIDEASNFLDAFDIKMDAFLKVTEESAQKKIKNQQITKPNIMKKVTILVGPQASGKTTLANEMTEGRKSVIICHPDLLSPFCFKSVNPDTEVIIFEEFTDIGQINFLISRKQLIINKPLSCPFSIDRPEIIIVAQSLQEHLIMPNDNVEIIHCVHHVSGPVVLDEYHEISKSDIAKLKESCK